MNDQSNSYSVRGRQDSQLQEIGRDIGQNAQALARSVESAVRELETMLGQQVEKRPYCTLAGAVGIGYVLGGGLPSRMTSLLLGIGSRIALAALAREMTRQQSEPSAEDFVSNAGSRGEPNRLTY
jgi:ElaB/YqjD/DUF883 family membrane-anchored ribosome-binding protein